MKILSSKKPIVCHLSYHIWDVYGNSTNENETFLATLHIGFSFFFLFIPPNKIGPIQVLSLIEDSLFQPEKMLFATCQQPSGRDPIEGAPDDTSLRSPTHAPLGHSTTIKLMKRGATLERGLVHVVDPLWHVLELGQDKPCFGGRPIQVVPSDLVEEVIRTVANHLHAGRCLCVPSGVL